MKDRSQLRVERWDWSFTFNRAVGYAWTAHFFQRHIILLVSRDVIASFYVLIHRHSRLNHHLS